MIRQFSTGVGLALVVGLCFSATGCGRSPAKAPPAEPPSVSVSLPVERDVTDYADFTARIAAVDSVEVRAHVWGYLQKVNFNEGDLVKKGQILFELDARPYQALLNQAKAKVVQDQAQLSYAEAEYRRNLDLVRSGSVSRSDMDKTSAARGVDIANIAADQAMVTSRQLDCDYTKVTAPVSGRISRYDVTVGNLILGGDQGGGTLLTTIVSVDPMYAYFDIDEFTIQRARHLAREGEFGRQGDKETGRQGDGESRRQGDKETGRQGEESDSIVKSADEKAWPVSLGLAAEEGFPHRGTINFVDNQLNPKTGTLRVRGVFPNGDGALSPGFFARVRLPVSAGHQALLVSERALDNDQGQRIVYVVNDKNAVVSRPVRLGQMHHGLRAIEGGLKPGERVIVNGLQRVRAGAIVDPKVVDMPGGEETRRQGDRETRREERQHHQEAVINQDSG